MFFYNTKFINICSLYLLNLNLSLHIELHNSKIFREECIYNDELVGFVVFIKI